MMFFDRGIRQVVGVVALLWVAPVAAQENLYANKSPTQIFASDCALCHKTPQSLSKAGGPLGLGLESFLRSHYTASRESAAVMARYIQSMDAPAAAEKGAKRGASGSKAGAKPAARKSDAKSGDTLPGDNKPVPASDTKTEAKPVEAKPAEAKPAEAAKPAEPKPEKSE
jgi:hypothetical protein